MADIPMTDRIAAARDALVKRTPRSRDIAPRAREVLPIEIAGTVEMPHTIYIDSAEGARMTDVDGNSYIDLTMGFGPHVLGHSPAVVREALRRQVERGWHFGIHNALQERLARLVVEASPCAEAVVFCNSGTEATLYAIRAARAFTRRTKIAVFEGSYHGAHDYVLVQAERGSDRHAPAGRPRGKGIPEATTAQVLVLPYRDPAAFELIERHRDELALVMIEPVQSSNPRLDNREFLRSLAEVCRKCGVLFMLDEVITGFRIAYGGCQEYFGVVPDLATYGKAVGGGLAVGAVAGRRDIMRQFSMDFASRDVVFAAGTFSGNPLAMAAGTAAVEYMRDHRNEIYPYLKEQGDRLASAVNRYCADHEIPARMMNAASMLHLIWTRRPIESARDVTGEFATAERAFYLHLLCRGVIVPGIHLAFVSTAHRPADIDETIEAFKGAFDDVLADASVLLAPRASQ